MRKSFFLAYGMSNCGLRCVVGATELGRYGVEFFSENFALGGSFLVKGHSMPPDFATLLQIYGREYFVALPDPGQRGK